MVRAFEDDRITHVAGKVGPEEDAGVVELELQLADMAQIERRQTKRGLDSLEAQTLKLLRGALDSGVSARNAGLSEQQVQSIAHLGLLTMKPMVFAINVAENNLAAARQGRGGPLVDGILKYAAVRNMQSAAYTWQPWDLIIFFLLLPILRTFCRDRNCRPG